MRTCATCKWYAYLTTFGTHLCHAPGPKGVAYSEIIPEEDTHKDCSYWEPTAAQQERCRGCPECMVIIDRNPAEAWPDHSSDTCRHCMQEASA